MSEQHYRSIGALAGMMLGVLAMNAVGQGGVVALFLFAGGGTVMGGIIGERLYKNR